MSRTERLVFLFVRILIYKVTHIYEGGLASSLFVSDKFDSRSPYPHDKISILKNFEQNVEHILRKDPVLPLNTIDDLNDAGIIQVSAQRYGGVLPSIGVSSHIPEEHWVPV